MYSSRRQLIDYGCCQCASSRNNGSKKHVFQKKNTNFQILLKKKNNSDTELSLLENSSEEALTRHLLKLSEIENQFRDLTNKFEELKSLDKSKLHFLIVFKEIQAKRKDKKSMR